MRQRSYALRPMQRIRSHDPFSHSPTARSSFYKNTLAIEFKTKTSLLTKAGLKKGVQLQNRCVMAGEGKSLRHPQNRQTSGAAASRRREDQNGRLIELAQDPALNQIAARNSQVRVRYALSRR